MVVGMDINLEKAHNIFLSIIEKEKNSMSLYKRKNIHKEINAIDEGLTKEMKGYIIKQVRIIQFKNLYLALQNEDKNA